MSDDHALSLHGAASRTPRVPEGERVYAIGDIHGRLDLLEKLVSSIRRDNAQRVPARVSLICIGDLIDRGPESAEIVRRCMAFSQRTDRFIVLKGNHEEMLVEALSGDFLALSLWLRSGGGAALSSWGVADELIEGGPSKELVRMARALISTKTLAWLRGRPLLHQSGDYMFVHAGISPNVRMKRQTPEDLLWIREEFLMSDADHHGLVVVHGHSVGSEDLVVKPNRIGIDTGAYRTDILSAAMLEADELWALSSQVPDARRLI